MKGRIVHPYRRGKRGLKYEAWDAIPSSAPQKIREAHLAREAAEAKLIHVQQKKEQEQHEAAASARSDIPEPEIPHEAAMRGESSAANTRDEPRLTSGGQDLAHQLARAMTLGPNAGLPHGADTRAESSADMHETNRGWRPEDKICNTSWDKQ